MRLDVREVLARLVAFDTSSARSNLPLLDYVSGLLDRPRIRLERLPSPDGAKANLVAFTGPPVSADGDRAGLILCGHTDTVPAAEAGWTSDPFTLTPVVEAGDDRWVGRGTCDMKGFLALAVESFLTAAARSDRLRAPLALLFTYDEEVGTLGAQELVRSYAEARRLPRLALIGEPTSLKVLRLHKGHLKVRLNIRGQAAHSSLPQLGVNAIDRAGEALAGLGRLRRELEMDQSGATHFPLAPFVTLNVGRIEGGSAVNIVPDRCILDLGIRLLPGMASDEMVERVRLAARSGGPRGDATIDVEVLGDSPPLNTPPDSPLVVALRAETGDDADAGAPFASDGGPLQHAGIESVLFGPGSIAAAHRANEFLPRAEFEAARQVVGHLVQRFCEVPEASECP